MCNMKFHHLPTYRDIYSYTMNILLAWFQFIEDSAASWKAFKFLWGFVVWKEKAKMYIYFEMARASP